MNEKSILNKVRQMLGIQVSLEMMTLDNGTVIEADAFESGQTVSVVTEGEGVLLPIGEYTLDDGRVLVILEDGVIAEIKEAQAEEPTAEAPAAEAEMTNEAAPSVAKKIIESVTKETVFSAEDFESLKAENAALKTELASMKEAKVVLTETPSFKHSPEKETAQREPETPLEKFRAIKKNYKK